jgi:hypothetical protein
VTRNASTAALGCLSIGERQATGSSKYQLVLQLNMLERRADATGRKALAGRALAAASGTRLQGHCNNALLDKPAVTPGG